MSDSKRNREATKTFSARSSPLKELVGHWFSVKSFLARTLCFYDVLHLVASSTQVYYLGHSFVNFIVLWITIRLVIPPLFGSLGQSEIQERFALCKVVETC